MKCTSAMSSLTNDDRRGARLLRRIAHFSLVLESSVSLYPQDAPRLQPNLFCLRHGVSTLGCLPREENQSCYPCLGISHSWEAENDAQVLTSCASGLLVGHEALEFLRPVLFHNEVGIPFGPPPHDHQEPSVWRLIVRSGFVLGGRASAKTGEAE